MSSMQPRPPRPLPLAWSIAGSVLAMAHLLGLGLYALATPSGPWVAPPPINVSTQEGPIFAKDATLLVTYPYYLRPLRMTHNYHFESNRPDGNAIYFKVILKKENGETIELKFPDDKANFWVRHRQSLIARGLGNDQPVQRAGAPKIAPAGDKDEAKIDIWKLTDRGTLVLDSIPEQETQLAVRLAKLTAEGEAGGGMIKVKVNGHLEVLSVILRDDARTIPNPAFLKSLEQAAIHDAVQKARKLAEEEQAKVLLRPSDTCKLLLQSYVRYLCRKHNAVSAEVVRHHRDAVTPAYWFIDVAPPADTFLEIKSSFGVIPRE